MSLQALYDLPAPAKLNLFLHIVGRREDGYHLLQSLFVLIDWADTLHVERRADGELRREDLGPALPPDDLCLRAAHALREATGCTLGATIRIDKRVPWGAGLGGGSSDAATVLLALNRLWGLGLPRARLAQIGLSIGADVPFFIGGTPAFVEGIGERLTPVSLPPAAYVVLKPQAAIATRDIFTHPSLRRDTEPLILAGSPEHGAGRALEPGFGRNDLQGPAEAVCPEVAEAARWLEARHGNSRMSGSGSAVFARVDPDSGSAASSAAMSGQEGQGPRPGWVTRFCRSLPRHPLVDWAG